MTKLFISQPMRGRRMADIVRERKTLVADAAVALQEDEIAVLDTLFDDTDATPLALLARALGKLAEADAVIFAPGLGNGARVPHGAPGGGRIRDQDRGGVEKMEEQNMFLWIKAAVTALCAAFSAAFGWLGWLVLAWAVCMVIDWISGSAAAASKGEWSSAVARAGIWHKAGMVVVVIVAAMADGVLGVAVENLPVLGIQYTVLILPVVLVWYIFTELGSIAENAAAMGAPVPEGLIKLLAAGKRAAEKCVPDTDTDEKNCE